VAVLPLTARHARALEYAARHVRRAVLARLGTHLRPVSKRKVPISSLLNNTKAARPSPQAYVASNKTLSPKRLITKSREQAARPPSLLLPGVQRGRTLEPHMGGSACRGR
jgi:hypothetical protein